MNKQWHKDYQSSYQASSPKNTPDIRIAHDKAVLFARSEEVRRLKEEK